MAVSSTSAGLDVQTIVSSLISAERTPITKLENKAYDLSVKLSAIGSLKSALYQLEDAASTISDQSSLGGFKASSSDDSVIEVTSNDSETLESHDIEVSKLASNHRVATSAFSSLDDRITPGTYTFGNADESFDIKIIGTMSVDDLRQAINESSDNNSITATTINTGNGYQLLLSAREGGSSNAITTTPAGLSFTEVSAAEDGEVTIDGLTFATTTNDLSDVLPGLSLTVNSVGSATVETELNSDAVLDNLYVFVNAYNSLISTMNSLSTDELQGEGITRSIETRMRTAFFNESTDSDGVSHTAFEYGLSFDKYGSLSVNSATVQSSMSDNFNGFMDFFTGSDGFASMLSESITALTGYNGTLSARQSSYQDEMGRLDDRISQLEYGLSEQEQRYYQQYAKLDAMLVQMNDTSSSIASQLSAINNTD